MTTFRTGNGAAWLDLLASLRGRYRAAQNDTIDSPDELRRWFRQFDLEPSEPITDGDVTLVVTTREALHRATVAMIQHELPTRADQRTLNRALQSDQPVELRLRKGELELRAPVTAAQALARLVRDGVQLLAGPDRAQLHFCGDDTCSGIFLDQTGRRRWCSDQQCGNRLRVAAHRARAKQQA